MLTRDELELIRAKVAGDSFDELDAGALLDHIDAISEQHEALVQSSNQDMENIVRLRESLSQCRATLRRAREIERIGRIE